MKKEINVLNEGFEELMRCGYPDVVRDSVQYRESRLIFYAGAAAVFYYVLELTRLGDEKAEEELNSLGKQIEEFFGHRIKLYRQGEHTA